MSSRIRFIRKANIKNFLVFIFFCFLVNSNSIVNQPNLSLVSTIKTFHSILYETHLLFLRKIADENLKVATLVNRDLNFFK